MKRVVVKEHESTIKHVDVRGIDICVGKRDGDIYKLQQIGRKWAFCKIDDSISRWSDHDTTENALKNFIDNGYGGGEVYVLDSLKELADFIRNNS